MAWWLWVVVGALALAGEALSMALFLLNVAIAAFAVALLVLFAAPPAPAQVALFVAPSVLLIGLIRPRLLRLLTRRAQARPTVDQGETIVGRLATVTDTVTCDSGAIQVGKAEFWTARLASPSPSSVEEIPVGARVRVAAVHGLTARVELVSLPVPATPSSPGPPSPPGVAEPALAGATPEPEARDRDGDKDRDGAEPPAFGALLRSYRTAAGLTQEELAERARLSVRAISDLERGLHRSPQKETVALLADALALSPEDRRALAAARQPAPHQGAAASKHNRR